MDWKNVKRTIIFILLICNVFVAVNLVNEYRSRRYLPQDELDGVVKILESRRISVADGAISPEILSYPIYEYDTTLPYSAVLNEAYKTEYSHIQRMLKSLLGKRRMPQSFIDIPGGVSTYISASQNENGASLTLMNDGYIRYITDEFPAELLDGENERFIFGDYQKMQKESADTVRSFFSSVYGYTGAGKNYELLGAEDLGEVSCITAVMKLDGLYVPGMTLRFFVYDGNIVAFDGYWCFNFKKAYSASLLDCANVILKLECGRIISTRPVYTDFAAEKMMIPAWSVLFEDEDGKTVNNIYDAITGEIRVSKTDE